jgi:predicted RNase H-like HicB family nuclease
MQSLTLSAVLNAEDDGYVALCPELDIASQGDSIEQALENLKEAVEGFFEVASQTEIEGRLVTSRYSAPSLVRGPDI